MGERRISKEKQTLPPPLPAEESVLKTKEEEWEGEKEKEGKNRNAKTLIGVEKIQRKRSRGFLNQISVSP